LGLSPPKPSKNPLYGGDTEGEGGVIPPLSPYRDPTLDGG